MIALYLEGYPHECGREHFVWKTLELSVTTAWRISKVTPITFSMRHSLSVVTSYPAYLWASSQQTSAILRHSNVPFCYFHISRWLDHRAHVTRWLTRKAQRTWRCFMCHRGSRGVVYWWRKDIKRFSVCGKCYTSDEDSALDARLVCQEQHGGDFRDGKHGLWYSMKVEWVGQECKPFPTHL